MNIIIYNFVSLTMQNATRTSSCRDAFLRGNKKKNTSASNNAHNSIYKYKFVAVCLIVLQLVHNILYNHAVVITAFL